MPGFLLRLTDLDGGRMARHASNPNLLALFTDFGGEGLYVGQMKAVLAGLGAGVPVIDLMSDAPTFDPRASAYLLDALARSLPEGVVFVGVVDPGVGSDRPGLVVRTDSHWFVGPDNGLFSRVCHSAGAPEIQNIEWRPAACSESFHGRDIFAPVAAGVCKGEKRFGARREPSSIVGADWPEHLPEVIYVDHFGNALTGVRADSLDTRTTLRIKGRPVGFARTFSEAPLRSPFWYANSLGLVEIAVNQGSARALLGIAPGDPVEFG